jgi:succinate dehydrogenase flavin-adding protein (antitoxin of CptAB toxin-antitoxin module)
MCEPITVRRKRLLHRSRYRGCREADLILGQFADQYVMSFDRGQLDLYERLIEESDQDLLSWLIGSLPPPQRHRHDVFDLLRRFRLRG